MNDNELRMMPYSVEELEELMQKKIKYTMRNYVRLEKYNSMVDVYGQQIIDMNNRINELNDKINKLYFPMRG